nr:MAG TPA: erythrocyte binding antigen [Microviridae sp.]
MKSEKKFTWCIRYFNLDTCKVRYHTYFNCTTNEISDKLTDFVASHKNCIVSLFKLHNLHKIF